MGNGFLFLKQAIQFIAHNFIAPSAQLFVEHPIVTAYCPCLALWQLLFIGKFSSVLSRYVDDFRIE